MDALEEKIKALSLLDPKGDSTCYVMASIDLITEFNLSVKEEDEIDLLSEIVMIEKYIKNVFDQID